MGNGDGTFVAPPVTSVGSTSAIGFVVTGDFNGDGKMDVAAMSQNSTDLLFYAGHGDGTFAPPVSSSLGKHLRNAVGAMPGDFNGDGVADLAIVTTGGFAIALSQKNGSFQPLNTIYKSAITTTSIAVGDFNGDGKIDVATPVCSSTGGPTRSIFTTETAPGDLPTASPSPKLLSHRIAHDRFERGQKTGSGFAERLHHPHTLSTFF